MTVTKVPSIGTTVGVRYGGSIVRAVLIEDRGVLGSDHIVRVHVGDWDDPEAPEFEVSVGELVPEPAAA